MKVDAAPSDLGLRLHDMQTGEVYERIGATDPSRFYLAVTSARVGSKPTQLVNLSTGVLLGSVREDARFLCVNQARLVIGLGQQ